MTCPLTPSLIPPSVCAIVRMPLFGQSFGSNGHLFSTGFQNGHNKLVASAKLCLDFFAEFTLCIETQQKLQYRIFAGENVWSNINSQENFRVLCKYFAPPLSHPKCGKTSVAIPRCRLDIITWWFLYVLLTWYFYILLCLSTVFH